MVYTVFHKASSFAGYCVYLFKNSIHLKRRDVFIFMQFKTTLVKFQICSFIVYKDFASRSQDMFYLPNTALTYGGAAGVWYGITQQLGGAMSLPDYNLYMDVEPQ